MYVLIVTSVAVSTFTEMKKVQKHRWLLAVIFVPVSFAVFMVARNIWWELRPFPDFPSLAKEPDSELVGTVVFFDSFPDNCVHVVPASGGQPRKVTCIQGELTAWLPDGRVQVTSYGNRDKVSDDKRVIVDIRTGSVVPSDSSSIPRWSDVYEVLGPEGERLRTVSRRGRLTLFMKDANGERELFTVSAPTSYTLGYPAWSPTGEWFVVKDGLDRLLTITTDATPTVRVLAKNAWGQAVTGLEIGADSG